MAVSLCSSRLHSLIRLSNCRHYSGYVVLLPEIASNLPEQNPLLKDSLPDFTDITAEKCVNTLGKSLLDLEHEVFSIEAQLKATEQEEIDNKDEYSRGFIQKVVQPLQIPSIALDVSWGIVKTVFITDGEKLPSSKYMNLHNRAHRAQFSKYSNSTIYKASKECDLTQLSEEEQRVVERYQLEGNLGGLGLSKEEKEAYDNFSSELYDEKRNFNKRIELSKKICNVKVLDPFVVRGFPAALIEYMAPDRNDPTVGPWEAPIDTYYLNKFLEYCPDVNLRSKTWKNKIKLASLEVEPSELQNSVCLEKIRNCRAEIAEILGYPNYAALSMETKMAGTLENVFSVLESLRGLAFEAHKEEIKVLQEFASANGFKGELNVCDVPYWSRKQKKMLYNFENEELRDFFPFENVFSGLLTFCEKMFGIRFELAKNVNTWHPDVKFYHIFEGDSVGPVAGFYFDPFTRAEKLKCEPEDGWIVSIRPAHQMDGPRSVPLCSFIMNLPPPLYGKPSLLSYSEVEGLFGKFGRLLQHLLCTVSYAEVAGTSHVEWDAVDITAHFMTYCLREPKLLQTVSGHYSSGEKLPVPDMKTVSAHMAGTALCSDLYKSVLDLRLYSDKKFWRDIVKEIWPLCFVYPLHDDYREPLSMPEIVTQRWATGYFSCIWSKMVAADVHSAFKDDDADEIAIGSRFRDTYLAFGGGCDPHEIFRRFRGRDPTPESFIRYLKLEKEKVV